MSLNSAYPNSCPASRTRYVDDASWTAYKGLAMEAPPLLPFWTRNMKVHPLTAGLPVSVPDSNVHWVYIISP